MKIGVTGTALGMSDAQWSSFWGLWRTLLDEATELHHGDCIGADAQMVKAVRNLSAEAGRQVRIVSHPCTIFAKRAYAQSDEVRPVEKPLVRNVHIVQETDALIATPHSMTEQIRSGTWHTVRQARLARKPVYIIRPDGTIREERTAMKK